MAKFRLQVSLSMLAFVLSACGGEAPASSTPPQQSTTGDEHVASSWPDMNRAQRFAYMQDVVLPEMATLFQEFDGETYADFSCANCHGADAEAVGFEMPNGLAPLNPAAIPAMFASEEPVAVFMTQRVWPKMTELLDEAPYNPETQQGFSCLNCHAIAEGG